MTTISGQLPCGFSCTYFNTDVIIDGVTFDPHSGPCSFSVTVYNGTITVLDPIVGNGAEGTDAVAVNTCFGSSIPAYPANPGANITLRSLKSAAQPQHPVGIIVMGSILTSGGVGGDGSTTGGDRLGPDCAICFGGNALAPTDGGAGGSITLRSDGTIETYSALIATGGTGGSGADGASGVYGAASYPSAGGRGGNGGTISITQTGTGVGPLLYAPLYVDAGSGNIGGRGATGLTGSTAGAAGGDGGTGGTVILSGPEPTMGTVRTSGGLGADGGFGADASPYGASVCQNCFPCPGGSGCLPKLIYVCGSVQSGYSGGRGGDGGAGGPITITATRELTINQQQPELDTRGGYGAIGGGGGSGAHGFDECPGCPFPSPSCGHGLQCPGITVHGNPGASGKGGAGGKIAIKARSLITGAMFNTVGGCGADARGGQSAICVTRSRYIIEAGQPGCPSECDCAFGSIVCGAIPATSGAAGGAGGSSGSVTLSLTTPLAPGPVFRYCGGGGGEGGRGGDGFECSNWIESPAGGGQGGIAGASGSLTVSGVPFAACGAPVNDCGTQVMEVVGGLVIFRGQNGMNGVYGSFCPCAEF